MRLLHYTPSPFAYDPHKTYPFSSSDTSRFKPNGLWVSVEGRQDWREWCEAEHFKLDSLKFCSRVLLKRDANVLMIDTARKFEKFHDRYAKEWDKTLWVDLWVDWAAVAEDYSGVVIAPYQWAYRLSHRWYHPWDCASGAIWDLSAIVSVVPTVQSLTKETA